MADAYWSNSTDALFTRVGSSPQGLSAEEAARRLSADAASEVGEPRTRSRLRVLIRQIESPLLWLLIAAAAISAVTGQWSDAAIVLVIVGATVGIGYGREYRAELALSALRARVQTTAVVVRAGRRVTVPRSTVVVGDVVALSAGTLVPADAVVFEASDCYVTESVLTGESFPVMKRPGAVAEAATLSQRQNCVFLGTNVRSGTALCLVLASGTATELARIATRLAVKPPETDFDRGIRHFGYLLTVVMLIMVLVVFVAHMLRGRPPVETLLFSVALAVGLSPELLPAILSVNLARGAQEMAKRGVLVRRLTAIENLGSMDVLCTDKTGTLTEGTVRVDGSYDASGAPHDAAIDLAAINARLQTGLGNPLDEAILEGHPVDLPAAAKLGEIPFDFVRKRLSVIIDRPEGPLLIAKGAFAGVLAACTRVADGPPIDAAETDRLTALHRSWSEQGIRVIAVATRAIPRQPAYGREDEAGLALAGFVTFLDRPKAGVLQAITDLGRLGVQVKIITGDNRLVTEHVARTIGLEVGRVLTGADLTRLDNAALWRLAPETTLFVEVDPNQKERIILALKRAGRVVGFMGDGVNDAPAMHVADASLSVDTAVDVARATADFVLLDRDLDVIRGGIEEGRKTFANTLKYVRAATSANLGNMLSMAAASLVLPFLPLLAGQVLLNNLLADVPALGIADDRVDPELVEGPPRWDLRFIARYMFEFGLLSSVFDAITFATLLWGFSAGAELFRTGWFVESLLTELAVALVVRTRRPFFTSRPGTLLLWTSLVLIVVTPTIPLLPGADRLGFVHLPGAVLGAMLLITASYVATAEVVKHWFYWREARRTPRPGRA